MHRVYLFLAKVLPDRVKTYVFQLEIKTISIAVRITNDFVPISFCIGRFGTYHSIIFFLKSQYTDYYQSYKVVE